MTTKKKNVVPTYQEIYLDKDGNSQKKTRIDWELMLSDEDYTYDKNDNKFINLHALERLAKMRGVLHLETVPSNPIIYKGGTGKSDSVMIQCTAKYTFNDGQSYTGSGDATNNNVGDGGNFKKYLTAVAQSRAKARALRNSFYIKTCSVQQVGNIDQQMITPQQKKVIERKLEYLGLTNQYLKTQCDIKDIDKVSRSIGGTIIKKLNSLKPGK